MLIAACSLNMSFQIISSFTPANRNLLLSFARETADFLDVTYRGTPIRISFSQTANSYKDDS
jgi:hypothetical protein